MTDIRHPLNRRPRVTGGSLLCSQDLGRSHPPATGARHDSVVTPWCRLRTIVDALLHRVATSPDGSPLMAAMTTRTETQERTDG